MLYLLGTRIVLFSLSINRTDTTLHDQTLHFNNVFLCALELNATSCTHKYPLFKNNLCTIQNPGNRFDFFFNNDDEYLSLESSLPERMKYGNRVEA